MMSVHVNIIDSAVCSQLRRLIKDYHNDGSDSDFLTL